MKIYNYNNIINNIKYDSISKYNISKNINNLIKLTNINFFVSLKSSETNFLKSFFDLSKLIFDLFDRKIHVFSVSKENYKFGKFRNGLIFNLGITLRGNLINKNINYIRNIIYNISKKIDNSLIIKRINKGYLYKFSNVNYLLGLNNENYFKSNFIYNFEIKYDNKLKKILKFYEKLFF